jgi:hypothetical protein
VKIKMCKLLVLSNFIFWLIIAVGYSIYNTDLVSGLYTVIKILLFLEPILFLVLLIGILKQIKIIYLLGLILTLLNSVLSITDELGILDLISLILSLGTLISLIFSKPLKG